MADLRAISFGSGPDVVMLHPFPLTHEFWLAVAQQLAGTYRVTLYDLRGLGESTDVGERLSIASHADDLARLCRAQGIERSVFAGCSIGGYILLEYFSRHRGQFRGLILCDTRAEADTDPIRQGRVKSIEDIQQNGAEAFFQSNELRLLSESTRRNRLDVVDTARAMMRENHVPGLVANLRALAERKDYSSLLDSIDVPTLILNGSEDAVTSPEVAHGLNMRIAKSKLQMIPNAGHLSAFERPEEAGRLIKAFLDSIRH